MIKRDLVEDYEVDKYSNFDIISIYPSTSFGYVWVWYRASESAELAATDNQHTQHAIAALRSALSCHPVNLDLTAAIVASFEKELQQHAGA